MLYKLLQIASHDVVILFWLIAISALNNSYLP